jgi:RNA polymerase sigma-70 factor, ECF subfamily
MRLFAIAGASWFDLPFPVREAGPGSAVRAARRFWRLLEPRWSGFGTCDAGAVWRGLCHAQTAPPPDSCNFPSGRRVLSEQHGTPVPTEPAGAMTPVDFTTFMRNYQDMVYTTAVRLLNNEAQAEDISQEVFIKAYERFEDLSTSPTAGGWLKTVTTNLSLNHLQRYRKRWRFFSELVRQDDDGGDEAPVEFSSPDDDFLAGLNQNDRREWVERALAKLPEHQRVPLVLYHFEDVPYDEIARRLRVSLAKVKTDILRGRAALAQILSRSNAKHETLQPEL